jgi:hypothetical protein
MRPFGVIERTRTEVARTVDASQVEGRRLCVTWGQSRDVPQITQGQRQLAGDMLEFPRSKSNPRAQVGAQRDHYPA